MKLVLVIALICALFMQSAVSEPSTEAIEIIEGILVGAFGDVGHKVKTCIKDGEEIFKDIESAVKHFEKGTRDEIIQGLIDVGKALILLPEEVKDCEEIPDLIKDIEIIAAEFMNPEELIVKIGVEILWHGISIYDDVTDCVKQFKAGKYEPAGEDIGDILYILFLGKPNDVVIDAEDFLEGFFKGALEDDSVDINDCITDATEVIEELETIIGDIKSGVTEDVEKLFLDFIDLITYSVESVAQCEHAPAELSIMEQWAVEMQDLTTMEHKLFDAFLYYPDRLKDDFKGAMDNFDSHTYSESGFAIGDILHVLFVDINGANDDVLDDAVEFIQSYYSYAFNINLNLSTCEADVEDEFKLIEKAIDELKELTPAEIKQGIEDLMKAVPEFIQAFDECKSDWPDLEKGLKQLEIFIEEPEKLPWAITKACTIHFIRVESDSSMIYHAFHDSPHDYSKGGEGSGDITALLISELEMALAESRVVEELK